MNMIEALKLCKDGGHHVRPLIWKSINPRHWIEARQCGVDIFFFEYGEMEEIPHALRLERDAEFLGEWEVYP